MAFPPRFGISGYAPQFTPYGTVTMGSKKKSVLVPVMQTPTYFVPAQMGQGMTVVTTGPRSFPRKPNPPMERPPVTTAFVGNIHERCSNDLIKAMLQECGNVANWKRIQGSDGKYQAFGFCEFDHPESTLRALRILNNFSLGDKKIVVRVDEKTRELLRGFIEKKRQMEGKPPLKLEKDQLPETEEMVKGDPSYLQAIEQLVKQQAGDLISSEEGEISTRSPTLHGKGGNLDIESLDREKKEYIAREISHFREAHKEDEKKKEDSTSGRRDRSQLHDRERSASPAAYSRSPSPSTTLQKTTTESPTGAPQPVTEAASASLTPTRPPEVAPVSTTTPATKEVEERPASRSSNASGSRRRTEKDEGRERREREREVPSRTDRDRDRDRERDRERDRRRELDRLRERDRDRERERERERSSSRRLSSNKRSRRSRSPARSSSPEYNRSRSRSSTPRSSSTRASKRRRRSRTRSRSRGLDSEEEEDAIERYQLERRMREKDDAYQLRLQKWELRERKRAKEYEKHKEKQKQTRRDEQREARKLKEFLEDYEDERDDPKYYKSGALFQRRRDYEKERQADARDRQKEKEELDEIRKKLLEEGHKNPDEELARIQKEQEEELLRKLRADSDEPPSPRTSYQNKVAETMSEEKEDGEESSSDSSSSDEEGSEDDSDSGGEEKKRKRPTPTLPQTSGETEPSAPSQPKLGFASLRLGAAGSGGGGGAGSSLMFKAFGEDTENEDSTDKKRVPFLISDKERAEALTPEEKKKLIKTLIERIPTGRDQLFAHPIDWEYVDQALIEKRVKPWVNKKIVEYIGEEEQTLVDFICQKVQAKGEPKQILEDIGVVLDEEAEVFVVKMWRLLIYEIEAKKLGLVKADGTLENPKS